jgi:pimeloyl-ACP methyl ester carboxylesterase
MLRDLLRLIILIASAIAALATFGAWRIIRRRQPDPPDLPSNHGMDFQHVRFSTSDDLLLHGWWIPAAQARGTVVICHGQNGSMDGDLWHACVLHEAGFNVLMFSFRAHGSSRGEAVTFGLHETRDLLAALNYLEKQLDIHEVGVLGLSMGAAVAILTAAHTNRIACIVADGLITRLDTTLGLWLHNKGLPLSLALPYIRLSLRIASWLTQAPMHTLDMHHHLRHVANCPIFFIHGADDELIPFDDFMKMVNGAFSPPSVWVAPGCRHREAHQRYPEEYAERIVRWFSAYFNSRML